MKGRYLRSGLTLLVLFGIVGAAGYWGYKHTTASMPGLGPSNVCTTKTVQTTLRASQVQISVYNDGTITGLAGKTMKQLTKRGFIGGAVGNTTDNGGKREGVRAVLVRTSTPNSTAAKLVAAQFGAKIKPVVSSVDLGPGIDVVLGNNFKGLVAGAPKSLPYTVTQQVCSAS